MTSQSRPEMAFIGATAALNTRNFPDKTRQRRNAAQRKQEHQQA